MEEHQIEKQIS